MRRIVPTWKSLLYHCAGIERGSLRHGTVANTEFCQGYQKPQPSSLCSSIADEKHSQNLQIPVFSHTASLGTMVRYRSSKEPRTTIRILLLGSLARWRSSLLSFWNSIEVSLMFQAERVHLRRWIPPQGEVVPVTEGGQTNKQAEKLKNCSIRQKRL